MTRTIQVPVQPTRPHPRLWQQADQWHSRRMQVAAARTEGRPVAAPRWIGADAAGATMPSMARDAVWPPL